MAVESPEFGAISEGLLSTIHFQGGKAFVHALSGFKRAESLCLPPDRPVAEWETRSSSSMENHHRGVLEIHETGRTMRRCSLGNQSTDRSTPFEM